MSPLHHELNQVKRIAQGCASPEAAGDDIDDSSDGDDSDDSDDSDNSDDDIDCSDQKLNERHSKNQKPPSMAFLSQVWSFLSFHNGRP